MIFALCALLLSSSVHAGAPVSSIDAFIDHELPASGAPGVEYAIVDQGDIRGGARGRTRSDGGRAITPDTPLLIGSLSKSFTALAIMQLAQSGTVDLDAGVGTYLDAFRGRASGSITLRQLLSHTSGYSTVQGNSRHGDDAGRSQHDDAFHEYPLLSIWEPGHLAQAHESDKGSNLANDDTPADAARPARAPRSKALR